MNDPIIGSGCPIRKPQDQSSVTSSLGLIAGSYVLHRLLTPRHPPHALNHLTTSTTSRRPLPSVLNWCPEAGTTNELPRRLVLLRTSQHDDRLTHSHDEPNSGPSAELTWRRASQGAISLPDTRRRARDIASQPGQRLRTKTGWST